MSCYDLPAAHLVTAAIQRTRTAYRLLLGGLIPLISGLIFLFDIHVSSPGNSNSLSPKVILNYLSSLKFAARQYNWDFSPTILFWLTPGAFPSTPSFNPTPRGIFDLRTLAQISTTCNILDDPPSIGLLSYWHSLPF